MPQNLFINNKEVQKEINSTVPVFGSEYHRRGDTGRKPNISSKGQLWADMHFYPFNVSNIMDTLSSKKGSFSNDFLSDPLPITARICSKTANRLFFA